MHATDLLLAALLFAVAVLYSSVGHAGASGYIASMALLGFAPEQVRPTALALNLLVGGTSALTLADIAALGVRRVSVGGALARSAWGGFMRAAQALAAGGVFDGFAGAASGAELNALLRAPATP